MNIRLTRLSKTEKSGNLRGEGVEGYTAAMPEIGKPFVTWRGNDDGTTRFVQTSVVKEVVPGIGGTMFRTHTGSEYWVEQLP